MDNEEMITNFKRIIGYITLLHIFPVMVGIIAVFNPEGIVTYSPFIFGYLVGWILNGIVSVAGLLIGFIFWCFD